MLVVFYRYSGSCLNVLFALCEELSSSRWTIALKRLAQEGKPFMRSDAYHANWGAGEGRDVMRSVVGIFGRDLCIGRMRRREIEITPKHFSYWVRVR